ncbi:MAG: hypothetical protein LBN39_12405 [Planctomycetaceae bacterium]|nr:hypothetical protein [Planctomycetaceae bacterium]
MRNFYHRQETSDWVTAGWKKNTKYDAAIIPSENPADKQRGNESLYK